MRSSTGVVLGILAAGWFASGCGITSSDRTTPPTSPSPPISASCDGSKAQWSIGQPASAELLERARVAAGATTARFLRPNQAITLEYFGWRLNLGLNEQDIVRSVNCG